MVNQFYSNMGWDPKTGKPLPETLRSLGLDRIIQNLETALWDSLRKTRADSLYVSFEVSTKFLLFDASSLEIEVIAGSAFGLEIPFSDRNSIPSRLWLCIPDDSRAYTLRNLLSELSSGYEQLEKVIWDRKIRRLLGNTLIILNGTHIDLLAGLDTTIKVGDRVTLLPFIAGG